MSGFARFLTVHAAILVQVAIYTLLYLIIRAVGLRVSEMPEAFWDHLLWSAWPFGLIIAKHYVEDMLPRAPTEPLFGEMIVWHMKRQWMRYLHYLVWFTAFYTFFSGVYTRSRPYPDDHPWTNIGLWCSLIPLFLFGLAEGMYEHFAGGSSDAPWDD